MPKIKQYNPQGPSGKRARPSMGMQEPEEEGEAAAMHSEGVKTVALLAQKVACIFGRGVESGVVGLGTCDQPERGVVLDAFP